MDGMRDIIFFAPSSDLLLHISVRMVNIVHNDTATTPISAGPGSAEFLCVGRFFGLFVKNLVLNVQSD